MLGFLKGFGAGSVVAVLGLVAASQMAGHRFSGNHGTHKGSTRNIIYFYPDVISRLVISYFRENNHFILRVSAFKILV